jgi:hypothetical protein
VAAKEDHIGRLAVAGTEAPLVVPLNFTFHDNGIFVRIGPGRLSELVPGSMVSFEVDRVEPDQGQAWSVLIRGLASALAPSNAPPGGADLPQPLVPIPGVMMIFIRPDVVTGRRFSLVVRDEAGVS